MELSGATTMRLNRNVAFIQFADIENGLQMEIQMRVASRLFFVGFVEFCHMLNKLKFYFIIQICAHMCVRVCMCVCVINTFALRASGEQTRRGKMEFVLQIQLDNRLKSN